MQRRRLVIEDFDAVAADAQRLLDTGYDRTGQWSLAQICDHLSDAMKGSIHGFPWLAPWIVRRTIGPHLGRKLLAAGRMKSGVKIPKKLLPQPNDDEAGAVRRLREAAQRVTQHNGAFQEHPLFGRLTADQWKKLHLIHAGHHLSFLVPKATSA